MNSTERHVVVLVTAPDKRVARKLAKLVLKEKLAACANLLGGMESHYWWQNKLEHCKEVLILFKTSEDLLPDMEKLVLHNHPYDTPEFIAISLLAGNGRYLDWLDENTK
jgi:periplasmic divalent cation tolerance protein